MLDKVNNSITIPKLDNARLSLNFSNLAINQLKASNASYHKRAYAEAVFSLQQAVENAVKAYALLVLPNINSQNISADIGHIPLKMLKDYIPQLLSQFQTFMNLVKDLDQNLNSATGLGGLIVKSQNIPTMVNAITQMNQQISQLQPQYTQMLDTLIGVMNSKGDTQEKRRIWEETLNLKTKAASAFSNLTDKRSNGDMLGDRFRLLLPFFIVMLTLLFRSKKKAQKLFSPIGFVIDTYFSGYSKVFGFAYITTLHQQPTRYPKTKNEDYWDDNSYTADKALVKNLPALLNQANKMTKGLKSAALYAIKYST